MQPISFRPLTREDFGLLAGWLAEPLVARWWHQDPSPAGIEAEYGPSVDATQPGEVCIASTPAGPLGLIQRYAIADYPEYLEELEPLLPIAPGSLSIDYLVGSAASRGRGLGTAMVRAFVADAWDRYPDAGAVVVPVHAENRASWRTLERAGFARVAAGPLKPDNPADTPDHVVYRRERPAAG